MILIGRGGKVKKESGEMKLKIKDLKRGLGGEG